MKALMTTATAAALLAGCAAEPQEPVSAPPPAPVAASADPMSPFMAPGFTAMAASSDQFEIQSSQMALEMSRDPRVRRFAQTMIDHHTRTTAELAQLAQAEGMAPPPPTLMPEHQAALDRIRAAGPDGFEAAYKQEQIASHQSALQLMRDYAAQGDRPPLREFAGRTAPIVAQHLQTAQGLPDTGTRRPAPAPAPSRAGERG